MSLLLATIADAQLFLMIFLPIAAIILGLGGMFIWDLSRHEHKWTLVEVHTQGPWEKDWIDYGRAIMPMPCWCKKVTGKFRCTKCGEVAVRTNAARQWSPDFWATPPQVDDPRIDP